MSPPIQVEGTRDSKLIVWGIDDSHGLYYSGYYGKPLGNPKPKEDFDEPLILDPVEGVYLLEKKLISVYRGVARRRVGLKQLATIARGSLDGFDDKLRVYRDLRDRGFVVTPGIKYGCDFAVYEHGPGVDHAPYIVQILHPEDGMTAAEIVKAGRLASTVRKTFITALVSPEGIEYLEFKWWKA